MTIYSFLNFYNSKLKIHSVIKIPHWVMFLSCLLIVLGNTFSQFYICLHINNK